jgi:hypothetical protein
VCRLPIPVIAVIAIIVIAAVVLFFIKKKRGAPAETPDAAVDGESSFYFVNDMHVRVSDGVCVCV